MVTAKEAYKIMDEYIRKNPDDKITRMVEIDDSYVFGTKNHPSYGEMAIRKADGSIYIIHIVDYAEHVDSGDVVEIDITNGFKKCKLHHRSSQAFRATKKSLCFFIVLEYILHRFL